MMEKECPKCGAVYTIDDAKIPDKGAYATCSKCQTRFHIKKIEAQNGESEEETITCPNCGYVNTSSESCIKCGIIFSKYNNKIQKKQITQKIDEKAKLSPEDMKKIYEEEKARFEAREKIKSEKKLSAQELRHFVALTCSCILIIGCFLPWLQLGALFKNRGVDNPDGAIVLILAFISGSIALFNIVKHQNRMDGIYILTGLIGIITGMIDLSEVQSRVYEIGQAVGKMKIFSGDSSNVNIWNFVGSGLYVILSSSIVLFTWGLTLFFEKQTRNLNSYFRG